MSFICLVFLPPPGCFSAEGGVISTGEGTTSSVGSTTGLTTQDDSESAVSRQTTPRASTSSSASAPSPSNGQSFPHLTLSLPHVWKQTASYILWLDRVSDQHKPIDNNDQASNFPG